MNPLPPAYSLDHLPPSLEWCLTMYKSMPIVGIWLLLMILDVFSGLCLAVGAKTISSSISWRGMSRKTMTVLIVGAAAALEPLAGGLPLLNLACGFYAICEAISIVENAAAIGVPIPRALTDLLLKLRQDKAQRNTQSAPTGLPSDLMTASAADLDALKQPLSPVEPAVPPAKDQAK